MEALAFSPLRRAGWSRPYAAPSLLCTSLAQTFRARYLSLFASTCPFTDEKTGEVRALRRRVPNNRFASVVRPSYLTSVCQWPRRSLVRRIGIPRPRPRSRSVAAGRFGFSLASASSSSADGQQHIRCDSLIAMAMPCAPKSCRTEHHPRCAAIRRSAARSKHAQ